MKRILVIVYLILSGCVTTSKNSQCHLNLSRYSPTLKERQIAIDIVDQELAKESPQIAAVLKRMILDMNHPLNVTESLVFEYTRPETLRQIKQVTQSRLLEKEQLGIFVKKHPRRLFLFKEVSPEINYQNPRTSRFQAFMEDPQRLARVPALLADYPISPDEKRLIDMLVVSFNQKVHPAVFKELDQLTCKMREEFPDKLIVRSRVKNSEGIIDKLKRHFKKPKYNVANISDAIGARIIVKDVEQLARLYELIQDFYGTGASGRIIEVDNKYVKYNKDDPTYRGISMTIKAPGEHGDITFELQLATLRGSIAADMGHNTTYKKILPITKMEERAIMRFKSEAAALEQVN